MGDRTRPIEDYALIGDTRTIALVATDGSIDWLCVPRIDSGAVFAALLGEDRHGTWWLGPAMPGHRTTRRYREDTLVLETEHETASGRVRVIDFMPHRRHHPTVVRIVEGLEGTVEMGMVLRLRPDYGWVVPWVHRVDGGVHAVAGPDAFTLRTPIDLHGRDLATLADFSVRAGDRLPFVLTWHDSTEPPPPPGDPDEALTATESRWRAWARTCDYTGPYRDAVVRSLITLKALTYDPTGAVVAAGTTSLPEQLGGPRNWDYRYTWLRDASFTMRALLDSGYHAEAAAWRSWLVRTVAGDPGQLQIMYGVAGERRLTELELDWLPGYAGSRPVRVGNAAAGQFQLDVYGEVLDALARARRAGLPPDRDSWAVETALADHVASVWDEPDDGIWEVRGHRRHFTYSKVMAWVALDRAARAVEVDGLRGPAERWRAAADAVRADVLAHGFSDRVGAFTQSYGSDTLDASVLLMPVVGFLDPDDLRMRSTVDTVARDLTQDGLVLRYRTDESDDGLSGSEGTFLLCSFWLVYALALQGDTDRAVALYERLLSLRNDVGLLSEEYDPSLGRQLGNVPQAFSHVGIVGCATALGAALPSMPRSSR
jgi:GH15 family glucan-1,4-alpha-glucosidase